MDRVFDRFSAGFGMPSLRRMFDMPAMRPSAGLTMPVPAIDVSEDANCFRLTAELPGMAEKDIEVVLSGDTLTIKGEKRQESEQADNNYHLTERSYGSFQRSFYLPDGVDRENINAAFSKGVLTLTLPKTKPSQAEPKKIDVKVD